MELGNNIHFGHGAVITASPINGHDDKPLLKIGDNCVFGARAHLTACNSIMIGRNLRTGGEILISDNAHGNPRDKEEKVKHPDERSIYSKGPVLIGDNVWLGD